MLDRREMAEGSVPVNEFSYRYNCAKRVSSPNSSGIVPTHVYIHICIHASIIIH
jgi:hypothetical protein